MKRDIKFQELTIPVKVDHFYFFNSFTDHVFLFAFPLQLIILSASYSSPPLLLHHHQLIILASRFKSINKSAHTILQLLLQNTFTQTNA